MEYIVLTGTWLALAMSNWHFSLWKTKLNCEKWDQLWAVGVWSYWGDGTLHVQCSHGELLSQTQLKIFWPLKCHSHDFAHSTILGWDWLLTRLPGFFPLITQPWQAFVRFLKCRNKPTLIAGQLKKNPVVFAPSRLPLSQRLILKTLSVAVPYKIQWFLGFPISSFAVSWTQKTGKNLSPWAIQSSQLHS